MNSLKTIAVAIALLASPPVLSAPALAQVTATNADMALSAIMAAGSRAAQVARLRQVPGVGVVRLDFRTVPFLRDSSIPDVSEFRIMAERHAAGIRKLRAALAANPAARRALAKRGISVSRVVGAQISSNGSLRLYLL